jgi:hypothetical protein
MNFESEMVRFTVGISSEQARQNLKRFAQCIDAMPMGWVSAKEIREMECTVLEPQRCQYCQNTRERGCGCGAYAWT